MNSEKIKTYGELNVSEKEVIDCFRQMKLISDRAVCELFSYKLTHLLDKYTQLIGLRKEVHALLFQILYEIDSNELSVMGCGL